MAVFSVEVLVVEREEMKRPADAPDQLWGGPWFTPEVLVIEVEADDPLEAEIIAAQMGFRPYPFTDPYVVGAKLIEE